MASQNRPRIPSKTLILPAGTAWFAVTHPDRAENKWDPTNPNWSIRVVWEGEARKEVERLLGPLPLEALEIKKAELIAAAGSDMVKVKKAEAMEYEMPWREVLSKETGEPTGEIEIVFKRPAWKTDRATKMKVRNSPPATVNAQAEIVSGLVIPNRSIVVVKMATWPVYFSSDNRAGIKRLLESVQLVSLPKARTPDASGFQKYEATGDDSDQSDYQPQGTDGAQTVGADY
ncbi:hypothetical protein SAMN02745126_03982 [Enhydrobacter aerosaccus]|uniref:Uncharacterized protein n=1 Tax=Enhydrobacter aerosaccus TaxID=225324 RepID=A0A1T4RPC8_9HYPH|nr:hypothetical protein [Enhydrobacter aerosaccus]SKA17521.1 hypothetical protein SAMN02745126_03982 [Enhydrobacter aerosaccus]